MDEILQLESIAIVKKKSEIPEIPRIQIPETKWEENNLWPLKPSKRKKGLVAFHGIKWDDVEYDLDDQGKIGHVIKR